MSKLVSDYKI